MTNYDARTGMSVRQQVQACSVGIMKLANASWHPSTEYFYNESNREH